MSHVAWQLLGERGRSKPQNTVDGGTAKSRLAKGLTIEVQSAGYSRTMNKPLKQKQVPSMWLNVQRFSLKITRLTRSCRFPLCFAKVYLGYQDEIIFVTHTHWLKPEKALQERTWVFGPPRSGLSRQLRER